MGESAPIREAGDESQTVRVPMAEVSVKSFDSNGPITTPQIFEPAAEHSCGSRLVAAEIRRWIYGKSPNILEMANRQTTGHVQQRTRGHGYADPSAHSREPIKIGRGDNGLTAEDAC